MSVQRFFLTVLLAGLYFCLFLSLIFLASELLSEALGLPLGLFL